MVYRQMRYLIWGVAVAAALLLAACGGDNGAVVSPTPVSGPALATLTPAGTAVGSPTLVPEETAVSDPTQLPAATPTPNTGDDGYPPPLPSPADSSGYPAPLPPTNLPDPYPAPVDGGEIPVFTYAIINQYPHNPDAWTQGLVWHNGALYEGTGRIGQSYLRQVALESGETLQEVKLSDEYYGEGITILGDSIYQITWQQQTALRYDLDTFELIETFTYPTEGWGITHDGQRLIMSDGTNTLYFRDPETFAEIGRVAVVDGFGQPVSRLNELEFIDGFVYANVWQTERIARIDPETGLVNSWIDLTGLREAANLSPAVTGDATLFANAVLNGIAYDPETSRLFVTGKLWPTLFEVELRPSP